MIAAVLDTNVLASGIIGFSNVASTPGQILRAWRGGSFNLVLSEHIIVELTRTFQAPYFHRRVSPTQVAGVLALLRAEAEIVHIVGQLPEVATHLEDDLILATAVSGKVDCLVTGDRELQRLGSYQGVRILSPNSFLDLLSTELPNQEL